jgi:uncharacterized membrane protein YgdD (TMEM256/DUF423 family)
MDPVFTLIGALSAAIAVFAGGARAHLLDKRLPPQRLPMLEVGMRYQGLHAMGLLICALAQPHYDNYWPVAAGWLFVAGTVIFPGAMYTYALSGFKPALRLTPLGGLLFVLGWLALAMSVWGSF